MQISREEKAYLINSDSRLAIWGKMCVFQALPHAMYKIRLNKKEKVMA